MAGDAAGSSPTRGCGRSAARGSTSRTPRSWPGWPPTGRCAPSRPRLGRAGRPLARAAGEIHRDVCEKGYDPAATRSPSPTAPRRWTPRSCSSRSSGFLPPEDERVRGHVAGDPAGPHRGRHVRAALPQRRRGRRRPARRRGRVPGLQLLAGGRADPRRPGGGRRRALRTAARAAQRRRPARGGVRPADRSPAGQRAAGLQPRRAGEHRAQPGGGARRPGRSRGRARRRSGRRIGPGSARTG